MKILLTAFISWFLATALPADTLKLKTGGSLDGVIIQEDPQTVTLAFEYGTMTLERSDIVSIERGTLPASSGPNANKTKTADAKKAVGRIPEWSTAISKLAQLKWATKLHQIPATVIDVGVMRNVPYMSYRCATNYEVNVYGDPDNPAGIEIGILGDLLRQPQAKRNCLEFISSIITNESDRKLLSALDLQKDVITRNGLTFEITPETADDAYGGWWISVYDEAALDRNRASDKEISEISVVRNETSKSTPIKASPAKPPSPDRPASTGSSVESAASVPAWSDSDMKYARATKAKTTPTSSGGRVYVRSYHRKDGTFVRAHTRRR